MSDTHTRLEAEIEAAKPGADSVSREQLLTEGHRQARVYGVNPACAEVYAEGWAAAWSRAEAAVIEMERAMAKMAWDADFNAGLTAGRRVADLERLLRSVRLYGVGYRLKHGTAQLDLNPADVTVVFHAAEEMTPLEMRSRISVLEERIRKVREICGGIECPNCDHPVRLHDNRLGTCEANLNNVLGPCGCDWSSSIAEDILAALDGVGDLSPDPDQEGDRNPPDRNDMPFEEQK